MTYELIFSDTFKKQFSKLENAIQQRIISALERIRIRPEYFIKKIVGETYYRLRVGDYRVILDLQRDKMIIFIIEVGHRKNIHK